jgi:hypothetical protein
MSPRMEATGSLVQPAEQPRVTKANATSGEPIAMKKLVMLLAMVLVSMASARAQEPQVGRYQMVAVPASQSQTFPETLLLDTASGQTWILYHETGQSIEWLPLRFWGGKDRPQTPLPPSPDAVGVSR